MDLLLKVRSAGLTRFTTIRRPFRSTTLAPTSADPTLRLRRLRRALHTDPPPSVVPSPPEAEADTDEVTLSHDPENEGIVHLTLNRPRAKNALSISLVSKLRSHLDSLLSPTSPLTRVVILRSSTRGSFCAGADLKERKGMSLGQVDKFLRDLRGAMAALEGLPMPTIAAIDGPALGGGLEIALACDLRVAG